MNAREQREAYQREMGPISAERQERAAARRCKSCEAAMRFVKVASRWMPVDYDPHEGGNVLVWDDGRAEMTQPGGPASGIPAGSTLHYSHFATCPSADDHRRPR